MTTSGWLQIVMYLLVVLAITAPLGRFLTRVFQRERTLLDPVLRPVERLIYRLTGVDETREMRWTEYADRDAGVQRRLDAATLRSPAAARAAAVESAETRGGGARRWRSTRRRRS